MSYTVLARKYRPQKFSEVIGQEHVHPYSAERPRTGAHRPWLHFQRPSRDRKNHSGAHSGRGLELPLVRQTGRRACGICESCTEIRAGNAVDVIEIGRRHHRGIDEIRELREAARYKPARDRFKIYILDEAHQITDAAFNALLKTLEEPPDHIVFMLATTQPEDIPQTIRSRCQHFSFRAVKFDDIVAQLRDLCRPRKD